MKKNFLRRIFHDPTTMPADLPGSSCSIATCITYGRSVPLHRTARSACTLCFISITTATPARWLWLPGPIPEKLTFCGHAREKQRCRNSLFRNCGISHGPPKPGRWSGFFQGFHQIHKALCLMTQFIKLTQSHLHGLRGVSGQVVYVADGLVDLVAHG